MYIRRASSPSTVLRAFHTIQPSSLIMYVAIGTPPRLWHLVHFGMFYNLHATTCDLVFEINITSRNTLLYDFHWCTKCWNSYYRQCINNDLLQLAYIPYEKNGLLVKFAKFVQRLWKSRCSKSLEGVPNVSVLQRTHKKVFSAFGTVILTTGLIQQRQVWTLCCLVVHLPNIICSLHSTKRIYQS